MKLIKKLITLFFIVSIAMQTFGIINVSAQNYATGNYEGKFDYMIINKVVYVTQINKDIKVLEIPSKINGYSVKYISADACRNGNLQELSLPNSLKEIGDGAFWGTPIKKIIIPSNVTYIGDEAFGEIGHMHTPQKIEINNGVQHIGKSAFQDLFWSVDTVTIPESVRYIDDFAFYDEKLKNVYIMGMETELSDTMPFYHTLSGDSTIIYGYDNSKVSYYAIEEGYTFESLGKFTGVQKSGNRVCGYENSKKISGLKKFDGNLYYFSKARGNYAQTGLIEMNSGNIYYFSKKTKNYGQALTGWVKIGDKKYYFLSSGDNKYKAAKGWMKIKGEKYYFNSDGTMATGKLKINNKIYVFDKDGKLT
ncbi:MAG: leucine-rich repeat protein [Eubacterium sp.]|nr:leucine-rich repeat protein [Eubacterium sp.]